MVFSSQFFTYSLLACAITTTSSIGAAATIRIAISAGVCMVWGMQATINDPRGCIVRLMTLPRHQAHVKDTFPHGHRGIRVGSRSGSSMGFPSDNRAILKPPFPIREDLTRKYGFIVGTDESVFQLQLLDILGRLS